MKGERSRLRFLAPLRPKTPPHELTGEVAFLPMEAIGEDGSYDNSSARPAEEVTNSGYTYFEQGDVIRARVTPCFENRKGALLSMLVGGHGVGTTELFVFVPSPRIDPRFLYYVSTSTEFTEQGAATMYGAHGVQRVDDQFARDYRVWVPPVSTQHAIADYLDRETARIDALIAAKRRMVELIEKRRHSAREAMVTQAWQNGPGIRLGHLLHEIDERLGTDQAPQLLSVSIHQGVIPFADANPDRMPRAEDLRNYKKCRCGDIILNRMRAFQGGVGRAPVAGVVSPDYAVLRPMPSGHAAYLSHLLRAPWFVGQMKRLLRGIGGVEQGNVRTPRVNWDDLRLVVVPSPPPSTQFHLSKQLDSQLASSWDVQKMVERQVKVIQERRQALITAAVTGQLDIPEAA